MPCSKDFSKEKVNLDEIREYFDSHPGYALVGAEAQFPTPLKRLSQGLVGSQMTLRKVKKMFEDELMFISSEVRIQKDHILVSIPSMTDVLKNGGVGHAWKAICHRAVS